MMYIFWQLHCRGCLQACRCAIARWRNNKVATDHWSLPFHVCHWSLLLHVSHWSFLFHVCHWSLPLQVRHYQMEVSEPKYYIALFIGLFHCRCAIIRWRNSQTTSAHWSLPSFRYHPNWTASVCQRGSSVRYGQQSSAYRIR